MSGEALFPFSSCNGPIGLFDSGLGGLTVVRQLDALLPHERMVYVADQAHVPYGGRDLAQVYSFAHGITDSLLRLGCKAVVMACNISTATALANVQTLFPQAIVLGVIEPGSIEALQATRNRRIGVLTTEGTRRTGAYTRTLQAHDPDVFVLEVACPEFVPLVEASLEATSAATEVVRRYLQPLQEANVDTVVLGCTHYPFLLPQLVQLAPDLTYIDPALATIQLLRQRLLTHGLLSSTNRSERHLLTTTGDLPTYAHQLERFLPGAEQHALLTSAQWQLGQLQIHDPCLSHAR